MVKKNNTSPNRKAAKAGKSSGAAKPSRGAGSHKSPQDVMDLIFRNVCENHVLGITSTPKQDLALASGYKNPKSDTFAKAIQGHMKDGIFTRGDVKDSVALTEKGVARIPRDMVPTGKSNADLHEHYIDMITKKVKMGADKVRPLWAILKDRKAHSVNDLATKLGYSNPKSFGNTKILSIMNGIGLTENAGRGSVIFTNKAFPYKD